MMRGWKISQQFRRAVQDQNMDDETGMVCVNNECEVSEALHLWVRSG